MFSMRGWVELGKALAKFALRGDGRHHRALDRAQLRCWASPNEPIAAAITHAITLSGEALLALTARAGGHRRDRRSVPALALQARPQDDQGGSAQGDEGERELAGDEGPHPPAAARTRAAPDDRRGSQGRRRHRQPDPLRRGAALRREAQPRAGGGGEGRRPHGRQDPRDRHRERRAAVRGAAARPRAAQGRRPGRGNPRAALRRRGADPDLRVPAQDLAQGADVSAAHAGHRRPGVE